MTTYIPPPPLPRLIPRSNVEPLTRFDAARREPGRECNGCTMCCKVPQIANDDGSILSPRMEWCRHCEVGKGCRIYREPAKPKVCDEFLCLWACGAFRFEDRPDRVRAIVQMRNEWLQALNPDNSYGQPVPQLIYEVMEGSPGALASPAGQRLLQELANAGDVELTIEEDDGQVVQRNMGSLPIRVVMFSGERWICQPPHPWRQVVPRSRAEQLRLEGEPFAG